MKSRCLNTLFFACEIITVSLSTFSSSAGLPVPEGYLLILTRHPVFDYGNSCLNPATAETPVMDFCRGLLSLLFVFYSLSLFVNAGCDLFAIRGNTSDIECIGCPRFSPGPGIGCPCRIRDLFPGIFVFTRQFKV
jgi:hypothetical protein